MSADDATPPPRFRSVRFLARGGLGEVHVAEDLELSREVVVKTILPEHAGKPSAKTRFVREARLTALLEHPGVVPARRGRRRLAPGPRGQRRPRRGPRPAPGARRGRGPPAEALIRPRTAQKKGAEFSPLPLRERDRG